MTTPPTPTPYLRILPSTPEVEAKLIGLDPGSTTLPSSLLLWLLGREIAEQFVGERIVIVGPARTDKAALPRPVEAVGGLFHASVRPGDAQQLADLRRRFDYVILDRVTHARPDLLIELCTDGPRTGRSLAAPGVARLRTTVISDPPRRPAHADEADLGWVAARDFGRENVRSVRVHLCPRQLGALARRWQAPQLPEITDPRIQRSVARWARALTGRRTGIALAGGGVWTMQSVVVMRELERRGVPVDVLVGPSAGAMLGAYYGTAGLAGVARIVSEARRGLLSSMSVAALASSTLMQRYFASTLDDARIEQLPNEFYPTATDLSSGETVAFVRGDLATAVTAASACPPMIAPIVSQGHRFVDGAFSNNVPVAALTHFGVDLSLALNSFPKARRQAPERGRLGWLGRFVGHGPMSRMLDFTTAFNLLGSLSGSQSSAAASVAWSCEVEADATYLQTMNFLLVDEMIALATRDASLQAAIDAYEHSWQQLRLPTRARRELARRRAS